MALANPKRFETLLRVRRRQEDHEALQLAIVRRGIRAAETELAALERRQIAMIEAAAAQARGQFAAGEIQRYYQYERHLARWAAEKDAEIAQLKDEEARRIAAAESAMKERRMAERLDERSKERHEAILQRVERGVADEAALIRAWLKERIARS